MQKKIDGLKPQYNRQCRRHNSRWQDDAVRNHRKISCGNESGFNEFRWNRVTPFCGTKNTEI
jgi:hypothetical protein